MHQETGAEALLGVCRCWRDRPLLLLLWFGGLRVGEALGLCRSDLHLVPTATALACSTPGPHVHVVGRDNPNRARAKSGDRVVPVRAEVLSCYDRYLPERAACLAAEGCDFVLVNLTEVDARTIGEGYAEVLPSGLAAGSGPQEELTSRGSSSTMTLT